MKLIIGLGNPGQEYEKTRHNSGWRVIDYLAGKTVWKKEGKFSALTAAAKIGAAKVLLAKPETFMNNSGVAAARLKNFYKIKTEDVLVICDDIDLPLGCLRLRGAGSAGGHQGLDSVIKSLKSEKFSRLKIGIAEGKPGKQKIPSEDYVLKNFSKKGEEILKKVFSRLPEVVGRWVNGDIENITISIF